MAGQAPADRGLTGLSLRPRYLAGAGGPGRNDLLNARELLVVLVSIRQLSEEIPVTTTPDMQLKPGEQPRLAPGRWRVVPARSDASFAARLAGRPVRGRLPLTGDALIAEPVEGSAVRLAARTSAVSTGSPVLDRLLAGPGFLDARAYPEISFRSELSAACWSRTPSTNWPASSPYALATRGRAACRFPSSRAAGSSTRPG